MKHSRMRVTSVVAILASMSTFVMAQRSADPTKVRKKHWRLLSSRQMGAPTERRFSTIR